MSVPPAKSDSPIRLLCEQFMCFLQIRFSRLFCAPFFNKISLFKDLAMPIGQLVLFIADTNPRQSCLSCSLKIGNTFLILSYLQSK